MWLSKWISEFLESSSVRRLLFLMMIGCGVLFSVAVQKQDIDDFPQMYLAGAVLAAGYPEALYPDPLINAHVNAGFTEGSTPHALWVKLAHERAAFSKGRFIYTPPASLLFVPMALLPYRVAQYLFLFLSSLALVYLVWLWAEIAHQLSGCSVVRLTLVAGAMLVSPWALCTIRSGNISTIVSACMATAILGMQANAPVRSAFATAIAGIFKGTSVLWLPVYVFTSRWRDLAWLALFTVVALIVGLFVFGLEPYEKYFAVIVPTLGYSSSWWTNHSLLGVLARLFGDSADSSLLRGSVKLLATCLMVVLLVLHYLRRQQLTQLPYLLAACLGWVCWYNLFSPLSWVHYQTMLLPFIAVVFVVSKALLARILMALFMINLFVPVWWLGLMTHTIEFIPEPLISLGLPVCVLGYVLSVQLMLQQSSNVCGE